MDEGDAMWMDLKRINQKLKALAMGVASKPGEDFDL